MTSRECDTHNAWGVQAVIFLYTLHPIYTCEFFWRATFSFHTRARLSAQQKHEKLFASHSRRIYVWKQFAALVTDLTNYVEIYGWKTKGGARAVEGTMDRLEFDEIERWVKKIYPKNASRRSTELLW